MKLEIKNLSKSYGENLVLDSLNLELDGIRALVIIGPSGGGKTTLLRILSGLEIPEEGEISLDERRLVFNEKSLQEYRKTVGVVFQAYNLFPHLDAKRNITLPLIKVHGYSPTEAERKTEQLLSKFRLAEHAAKRPAELSGGQKQRIAIARALAFEPLCLFLDEPTSALDPELTGEVLDMIALLKEEGTDFVIVTHEIDFARRAGDYILFVDEGRIIEQGSPEVLLENPQTEELRRFLSRVL